MFSSDFSPPFGKKEKSHKKPAKKKSFYC